MPQLVSTPRFDRAYARHVKRDANRRECVDETLLRLEANPLDPRWKTHPLSGALAGHFACSCGYDWRVLFQWSREVGREAIILITVGTHDSVY
jgi:mRNA interferase YafQ